MNNNIFNLLKLMNAFNQPQNNQTNNQNPSLNNFPNEAYNQNIHPQNNINQFSSDNNILPLLMSMLGKNGDLSKIFTQNTTKKEKEEIKKDSSSPKDEILL